MVMILSFSGLPSLAIRPAGPELSHLPFPEVMRSRWVFSNLMTVCATLRAAEAARTPLSAVMNRTTTGAVLDVEVRGELAESTRALSSEIDGTVTTLTSGSVSFAIGTDEPPRGARMAWQTYRSAEAALVRAELNRFGSENGFDPRALVFDDASRFDASVRELLDFLRETDFGPERTVYLDFHRRKQRPGLELFGIHVSLRSDTYLKPDPQAILSRDLFELGDLPPDGHEARILPFLFPRDMIPGRENPEFPKRHAIATASVTGLRSVLEERLSSALNLERLAQVSFRLRSAWGAHSVRKGAVLPWTLEFGFVVGPYGTVVERLTELSDRFGAEFSEERLGIRAWIPGDRGLPVDRVPARVTLDPHGEPGCVTGETAYGWEDFSGLVSRSARMRGWVQKGIIPKTSLPTLKRFARARLGGGSNGTYRRETIALARYLSEHFPAKDAEQPDARAAHGWGQTLLGLFDRTPEESTAPLEACVRDLQHALLSLRR